MVTSMEHIQSINVLFKVQCHHQNGLRTLIIMVLSYTLIVNDKCGKMRATDFQGLSIIETMRRVPFIIHSICGLQGVVGM